jgi:hypothetical protein
VQLGKTWNFSPRCQENAYWHLNFQIFQDGAPQTPARSFAPSAHDSGDCQVGLDAMFGQKIGRNVNIESRGFDSQLAAAG